VEALALGVRRATSSQEPPFSFYIGSRARFKTNTVLSRCPSYPCYRCVLVLCCGGSVRYILGFGWRPVTLKTLIVADCKNEKSDPEKSVPYPLQIRDTDFIIFPTCPPPFHQRRHGKVQARTTILELTSLENSHLCDWDRGMTS